VGGRKKGIEKTRRWRRSKVEGKKKKNGKRKTAVVEVEEKIEKIIPTR